MCHKPTRYPLIFAAAWREAKAYSLMKTELIADEGEALSLKPPNPTDFLKKIRQQFF